MSFRDDGVKASHSHMVFFCLIVEPYGQVVIHHTWIPDLVSSIRDQSVQGFCLFECVVVSGV